MELVKNDGDDSIYFVSGVRRNHIRIEGYAARTSRDIIGYFLDYRLVHLASLRLRNNTHENLR